MKRSLLSCFVLLVFGSAWIAGTAVPAAAAAGGYDTTFGGTGIVFFDPAVGPDVGGGAAVQPDRKVLMFGEAGTKNFGLVRVKANGNPDTTFGGGDAKMFTNFGGEDAARAAAVMPDGRIVLVGHENISVARYRPRGAPDKTLSGDGKASFNLGTRAAGRGVTLQPDGKIIVAGAADGQFAVLRLRSNGTRDTTFGTNGMKRLALGKVVSLAFATALDASGRIVAVGVSVASFNKAALVIVRLKPNGSLDKSFSGDGKLVLHLSNESVATGVTILKNGKIVVVGTSGTDTDHEKLLVMRLIPQGDLDSTFGGGLGMVTTNAGPNGDEGYGVAVQSDGKLVVAGATGLTTIVGDSACIVVRYEPSGGIDKTFGMSGVTTINPGSGTDECFTSQMSAGKIVVGGESSGPGGFFAARLLSS